MSFAVAGVGAVALGAYFLWPNATAKAIPWTPPRPEQLSEYSGKGPFWTTEPDKCLPVRYAKEGSASRRLPPLTVATSEVAAQYPNHEALKVEKRNGDGTYGNWIVWTWAQYERDARRFAKALLSVGHTPYKSVSVCGFNAPQWNISFLGAMYANGMVAGSYTTNSPDACQYVAEHSESVVVVVDTVKTLEKYLKVRGKLPLVKHIVVYDEVKIPDAIASAHGGYVLLWDEFLAMGDKVADEQLKEREKSIKVENCCALIYTSGTTGQPKAVMVTHDQFMFMTYNAFQSRKPESPEHHILSYLPLSHVAGELADIVMPIVLAWDQKQPCTVWFARPDALKGSLPVTLKAVRPTMFLGVPRVWEKFVEAMKAKARENPPTGLKLSLVKWAKRVGLEDALARQCGGSGVVPRGVGLASKLVHSKVKAALGLDRCELTFSGAAPISRETLEFLASLGIVVVEAYGMSESCGSTTIALYNRYKFGTVGTPGDGMEVRIDHMPGRDKPGEGEICYRGRHIMPGYFKDPAKTREAIDDDGWLHSGDVGKMDEFGLISITGRIKELIIGAGGENIAPVPIEDEVKRLCKAISNAIMIGDKRKYNVMLVTLKSKPNLETGEFTDELMGDALDVNPGVTTVTKALTDPAFHQAIDAAIRAYNNGPVCVSQASKIQKFRILPHDISIPGGELTATLKLKRNVINEKYAQLIESMYDE